MRAFWVDPPALLPHAPLVPHPLLVLLVVALPRLLEVLLRCLGRLPEQEPVRGVWFVAWLLLPLLLPLFTAEVARGVRPLLHPPGPPPEVLAPGEEPPLDRQ